MVENPQFIATLMNDNWEGNIYTQIYLPAPPRLLEDALQKLKVTEFAPYLVTECRDMDSCRLEYIPENATLEELNFLAQRMSQMDPQEQLAFEALIQLETNGLVMQKLINFTHNIYDVMLAPAYDDEMLAEFYFDNDFFEELIGIPETVEQFIDYAKVGQYIRENENGLYTGGYYAVHHKDDIQAVYDGFTLPDAPVEEDYIFELLLAKDMAADNNQGVRLTLPINQAKIEEALQELQVNSLDECTIFRIGSTIPQLDEVFSCSEDIDKLNLLAERILELEAEGKLVPYKAALEFEDCGQVDFAWALSHNLHCYDFDYNLLRPEEYMHRSFLKATGLSPRDKISDYIDFKRYCDDQLCTEKFAMTDYGFIMRNGQTFNYETSY